MAIVTGTQTTYDVRGIREDLTNKIYMISPEETPFLSAAGKGKAKNTLHEWQTDALASADAANAQLDGDDITTTSAPASTVRVGNYTQISRKLAFVSGTLEAVDKAGRNTELAFQLAKRSAELKIDMETIMLGTKQGAVAGNTTTARKLASMLTWIKTNVDKDAGGTNPGWTSGVPLTSRTDGTQRAFTETLLKNVISLCWTAGANPKYIYVGSGNKAVASTFAGVATKTFSQGSAKPAVIVGAADVYVSDFGVFSIVPCRNQRNRDAWVLDFEMLEVDYLRPFQTVELAKTGDAEKRMLLVEYTLKVKNELGCGLVADLS